MTTTPAGSRDPFSLAFYEDWLPRRGEAPPPRHVSLDLTYRCNLRCNMCFLYGEHLKGRNPTLETLRRRRELTIDEWRRLLDELWDLGVRALVMTGGEALLKRGILDLLGFAREKGFGVSLLSNGSRIDGPTAEALVRSGPTFLRFSLEGDRETHDAICGGRSYDRLMRALEHLGRARHRLVSKRPVLGFETVIQRRNQDALHHVIEVARAHDVRHVTFSNVFFAPSQPASRGGQLTRSVRPRLVDIEPARVERELARCRALAEEAGIELICRMETLEEIEALYRDPAFSFVGRCFYPWLMARVNPYGDVIPCTGSSLVLGNLHEASFAEIWNGARYRAFRRDLLRAGLFRECPKCNTLADPSWALWDQVPVPGSPRREVAVR